MKTQETVQHFLGNDTLSAICTYCIQNTACQPITQHWWEAMKFDTIIKKDPVNLVCGWIKSILLCFSHSFRSFYFPFSPIPNPAKVFAVVLGIEQWEQCYQETIMVQWSGDLGWRKKAGWQIVVWESRQTLRCLSVYDMQTNALYLSASGYANTSTSACNKIRLWFHGQWLYLHYIKSRQNRELAAFITGFNITSDHLFSSLCVI